MKSDIITEFVVALEHCVGTKNHPLAELIAFAHHHTMARLEIIADDVACIYGSERPDHRVVADDQLELANFRTAWRKPEDHVLINSRILAELHIRIQIIVATGLRVGVLEFLMSAVSDDISNSRWVVGLLHGTSPGVDSSGSNAICECIV